VLIDAFRGKIKEWPEVSHGRIGAYIAQWTLAAMGDTSSERATRRAV